MGECLVVFDEEQVHYQPDHLTWCEVFSSGFVGEFSELADQLFEDQTHLSVADLVWAEVDLLALREKSLNLTDYFIDLIDWKCAGHDLILITPRERQQRGSQVSFTHPDGGYAIISALIAAGVVGDFRSPDILRFGFAPLYIGFADVWHAVDKFAHILETRQWDSLQFHARKTVT